MKRSTTPVLAAWFWLSGAGFSPAQGDGPAPPGVPGPIEPPRVIAAAKPKSRPVWTAELELRGGAKARGGVRLRGGQLVVTPEGGNPLTAKLTDIASLQVIAPDEPPESPWGKVRVNGLPGPWQSVDVGHQNVPGRATWNNNQFVIQASARARGEKFPSFHMVHMPMVGDGQIVARVVKIGNPDANCYGGIIMCSGPGPESDNVLLSVRVHEQGGEVSFRSIGPHSARPVSRKDESIKLPFWLRLVREGTTVNAYHARNGLRWELLRESPGRVPEGPIHVGLVGYVHKSNTLSETVIDCVSVNGNGYKPPPAIVPHVVLTSGSMLSTEILEADRTSLRFGGKWGALRITTPRVARIEFFPPLPEDVAKLVDGARSGLLMRTGDFLEGDFQGLADRKVKLGSLLFGTREHSVAETVDALVLRPAAEPQARYRVETQDGSILCAREAILRGGELQMDVDGVGNVPLLIEEIRDLRPMAGE